MAGDIESYRKIEEIVGQVIKEAPKTLFGIGSPGLRRALERYARKIESIYTEPLKQQISQLIQINEANQEKISELEKDIQETTNKYKTIKDVVLSSFSDIEIEGEPDKRKQFSVPVPPEEQT